MPSLEGQIILVTGSTQGVGEAIALEHNDVTAPDRSGGGEVMGQPVAEAADHVRTRAVFENQTKYLGIDGSVDVLEIAVREQAL